MQVIVWTPCPDICLNSIQCVNFYSKNIHKLFNRPNEIKQIMYKTRLRQSGIINWWIIQSVQAYTIHNHRCTHEHILDARCKILNTEQLITIIATFNAFITCFFLFLFIFFLLILNRSHSTVSIRLWNMRLI